MIIGLTGRARSGKDTAAAILVEEYNFTRLALADAVREQALALDPYVRIHDPVPVYVRLVKLVNEMGGWESAKQWEDVRRLLQRLGTEAGREFHGQKIWITRLLKIAEKLDTGVVISDVRFDNEARICDFVIEIRRDDAEPVNAHVSESGVSEHLVDLTIENNSTIDELARQVRLAYELAAHRFEMASTI